MFIRVLRVSSVLHVYSVGYMTRDIDSNSFHSCFSLFASMLIVYLLFSMAIQRPTPISALIHPATNLILFRYLLMLTSLKIEYSSTLILLFLLTIPHTTIFRLFFFLNKPPTTKISPLPPHTPLPI